MHKIGCKFLFYIKSHFVYNIQPTLFTTTPLKSPPRVFGSKPLCPLWNSNGLNLYKTRNKWWRPHTANKDDWGCCISRCAHLGSMKCNWIIVSVFILHLQPAVFYSPSLSHSLAAWPSSPLSNSHIHSFIKTIINMTPGSWFVLASWPV